MILAFLLRRNSCSFVYHIIAFYPSFERKTKQKNLSNKAHHLPTYKPSSPAEKKTCLGFLVCKMRIGNKIQVEEL